MYYVYILKSSKSGSGKAFVYKRLVDVALKKDVDGEETGVPKL